MARKIIFTILTTLLGAVFIFSGLTKLYPVELFELTFIDMGVANWYTAPVIARLMVGMEFLIGILLIFNLGLKKFTLPATFGVLLIFTLYLTGLWIVQGNQGNCKCFGNIIAMTPVESIVKNLLMLALTAAIYKWHPGFRFGRQKILSWIAVLPALVMPFVLNPPDWLVSYQSQPETIGYRLNLDTLYTSHDLVPPPNDLRKGKHIIACMSLTCPHCRIAAYKIHVINKKDPEIPFFFILNGKKSDLKAFFDETGTENLPYLMLLGQRFIDIAGYNMPTIMMVNETLVEGKLNYIDMDYYKIKDWLSKK